MHGQPIWFDVPFVVADNSDLDRQRITTDRTACVPARR